LQPYQLEVAEDFSQESDEHEIHMDDAFYQIFSYKLRNIAKKNVKPDSDNILQTICKFQYDQLRETNLVKKNDRNNDIKFRNNKNLEIIKKFV